MLRVTGYPVKEEYAESSTRLLNEIERATGELQYLTKQFIDGNFYMNTEEVAEYLRCDIKDIPKIKRYRLRTDKMLYKRSDVDEFMKSRIIGAKDNIV